MIVTKSTQFIMHNYKGFSLYATALLLLLLPLSIVYSAPQILGTQQACPDGSSTKYRLNPAYGHQPLNGKYYSSVEELYDAFKSKVLSKFPYDEFDDDNSYYPQCTNTSFHHNFKNLRNEHFSRL